MYRLMQISHKHFWPSSSNGTGTREPVILKSQKDERHFWYLSTGIDLVADVDSKSFSQVGQECMQDLRICKSAQILHHKLPQYSQAPPKFDDDTVQEPSL